MHNKIKIIAPKIFSKHKNIICGISTKCFQDKSQFGFNISFSCGDNKKLVEENRKTFFNKLGIKENQIAFTKQTHRNNIAITYKSKTYNNCDALITNKKNLFLSITVADCLPIFIYDMENKIVATIHSGWRGCVNGILKKTIETMQEEFNSNTKNFLCYLGPNADKCCYEVEPDVAKNFDKKFLTQKTQTKFSLDIKNFSKYILLKYGIAKNNIEISDYCTICEKKLLHSFRRDKNFSGRMMGIIGMKI